MNQDFILKATPAIARRLISMEKVCSTMKLSENIHKLATQDLISEDQYAAVGVSTEAMKNTIQMVLDYGLRSIIPCQDLDAGTNAAFAAVAFSKVKRTIVITGRHQGGPAEDLWIEMGKRYGLTVSTDPQEDANVLLLPYDDLLYDNELITHERRNGVLIIENDIEDVLPPLLEFEKTIIVVNCASWLSQGEWNIDSMLSQIVTSLFPSAPVPFMNGNAARLQYAKLLSSRGFNASRRDFYMMCNVVFDLLGEASPRDWFGSKL